MGMLIAESVLLLLTALLTASTAWWWKQQLGAAEHRLTDRSAASAAPSPSGHDELVSRIDAVRSAVDLAPILARLDALESKIGRMNPYDPAPIKVISDRIAVLQPPDLSPLIERLRSIQEAVSGVQERIVSVEDRMRIPLLDTPAKEQSPERVAERTQDRPRAVISRPPADLPAPWFDFDASLLLAGQGGDKPARAIRSDPPNHFETPAPAEEVDPLATVRREPDRNLLSLPAFGPPDDLNRIEGVGADLAEALSRIGVFYYWQIAAWNRGEVAFVARLLGLPSDRLERDDWVSQAQSMLGDPDAAVPPT